jgi:hypothetical protein
MRLRNQYTGVQVVVPDLKARRLVIDGTYKAVPDDEQPSEQDAAQEHAAKGETKSGPTSIAGALRAGAGPMWDHAG